MGIKEDFLDYTGNKWGASKFTDKFSLLFKTLDKTNGLWTLLWEMRQKTYNAIAALVDGKVDKSQITASAEEGKIPKYVSGMIENSLYENTKNGVASINLDYVSSACRVRVIDCNNVPLPVQNVGQGFVDVWSVNDDYKAQEFIPLGGGGVNGEYHTKFLRHKFGSWTTWKAYLFEGINRFVFAIQKSSTQAFKVSNDAGETVFSVDTINRTVRYMGGAIEKTIFATHELIDTGISVNAWSGGRTIIVMSSTNYSDGNMSTSGYYMVRCGYNGDNYIVTTIAESGLQDYGIVFGIINGNLAIKSKVAGAPNYVHLKTNR